MTHIKCPFYESGDSFPLPRMSGGTMHRELQDFFRDGKKNVANVDRKEAEALI